MRSVLEVFTHHSEGLTFTHELQNGAYLQFLDLRLEFIAKHVCWSYHPRSKKGLLPYDSSHSKLVKRSIASSCLQAALEKSCHNVVNDSFARQVERLTAAGFPTSVLLSVAEVLLKKLKREHRPQRERPNKRPLVIPYLHKISHNLKKVALRYDVPLVFSAPCKLAQLCARVGDKKDKGPACSVKHENQYVVCKVGVVYTIPLTCGKAYVGQTGRCVNHRLREHDLSLRSMVGAVGGHMPLHCHGCGCEPIFSKTAIIGYGRDRVNREILEAHAIIKAGTNCVSQTSLGLSSKEIVFLDTW